MLIGKRISGRYKVLEMIGGGGMSNVYLAHDMILDRDVAIKVLRYDFADEQELHRRFQREALSATSLAHPNIVSIYDVGEEENLHYIVMEYVKGQTLKQYIMERAPISPERSVAIMKQLTSAIAHAHQNQIIHRDIKPQNILLDEQGMAKVTDFGIAMALSATSFTQTNSVLGTVHYLSPEQARGGTATKKSDIYALGIVLYELLTGELPFSGESAVSIALKHLQTETPSVREKNPSIPQSLENIVLKATAKDPLHRYRSADDMLDDLNTVLLPERRNEPKFLIPADDEFATKAIPVIKEPVDFGQIQETKKIDPVVKNEPVPEPVKKKRKKWPWIVGIIFALLLTGVVTVIAFPGLFGPQKIEVPDVSGLEIEEAKETLTAAGFTIGDKTEQPSDEIEENYIIRTVPEAGKMRDEGTEISLYVSTGKETITLEDYRGKDISQITTLLDSLNFANIRTEKRYSDQPVDTIIDQNPRGGSEVVPEDTEITFTVSLGKETRPLIDLIGLTESKVEEYAKTFGYSIIKVDEKNSDTIPAGQVMDQKPKAGTEIEVGSTVEVVISKGPVEEPIKFYSKEITIPYEPEQEGVAQHVLISINDNKNRDVEPVEELMITEDTKYTIKMEIAPGQDAYYRIVRDEKIIEEKVISYEELE
ncbi:Stk1 family PASTA domain-containing Ser/Thr kinase [Chungangia koreensis]|uniref:non-specific serine/threonine protein kinase n=1 Tax=Chungangia koreensis TaxID=752657 RepID=A0ABV8X016_9LACT